MTFGKTLGFLMGALLLLLTGCVQPYQGADLASLGPATAEPTYYGKPTDLSSVSTASVKISAKFRNRALSFNPAFANKNTSNGLSGIAENVIPFAEFHIYDAAGNRVQQGETTEAGIAEFSIPRTAGTYTFKVFSRALNENLKISVLQDIYNNQPYSVSRTFTLSSSSLASSSFATTGSPYDISGTPVYAEANESISAAVEGGAFNIYYNIFLANKYIRTTINKNDNTAYTDLNRWWVADKVTAYWKAGFNPYSYVDASTSSLLSYYSPGQSKLYILGGTNGNVKSADTDHFDNSVVLHEYGHFLEDRYGFSSSPGGSHNGDFVIDPRLAWSEGWANYFQAAVRSHYDGATSSEGDLPSVAQYYYYIDTFGYKSSVSDNTGGISIAFNLNQDAALASFDPITPSSASGEGIFREVSIARTLYKFTRKTSAAYATGKYGGGIPFADVWKSFSGEDLTHNRSSSIVATSLRNANAYPLPNFGLFNKFLYFNTAVSTSNMQSIINEEKSLRDDSEYAAKVVAGGSTCARNISGVAESTLVYPRSNQLRNNDFFVYDHSGAGSNLTLEYQKTVNCINSSCVMDLDLILYKVSLTSPYTYFEDYWTGTYTSSDIIAQKRTISSLETNVGGVRSETIAMGGLPAGRYLINVKLNAYNKSGTVLDGTVQYNLKLGSSYLCP